MGKSRITGMGILLLILLVISLIISACSKAPETAVKPAGPAKIKVGLVFDVGGRDLGDAAATAKLVSDATIRLRGSFRLLATRWLWRLPVLSGTGTAVGRLCRFAGLYPH